MYPRDCFGLCCGSLVQADLKTLIESAGKNGFGSVSVWPTLYQATLDGGLSERDIKALLHDHDVRVTEIDPLMSWLDLELAPDDMAAAFYRFDEDYFYRMADVLGATTLNIIEYQDTGMSDLARIERLGAVCDRAQSSGLNVSVEFMSFSPIKDLPTALHLVSQVGSSNLGVNIDLWHHFRGVGTLEQLRSLDPKMIAALQVSDLAAAPWPNLMEETAMGRMLPGEGQGLVAEALTALCDVGVDVPVNLEVFSLDLMSETAGVAAAILAQSVDRLVRASAG